MNHTNRTLHSRRDLEPLPRFQLIDEDPQEAVPTQRRRPISGVMARRILQNSAPPAPFVPAGSPRERHGSSPEIAAEDILLEAYEPAPASRRTTLPPPLPPRARATSSIDIEVNELVRSSLEAAPPPPPELYHAPPVGWTPGPTPLSFAPVAMPSTTPPPAFVAPSAPAHEKKSAMGVVLVVLTAIAVLGTAAVGGFVVAAPSGSVAKLKSSALALASKPSAPPAPAPKLAAPAPTYTNEPAVPPAPPSNAGVSVDSLPKVSIDPKMTLIRFKEKAAPHRVFVDGKLVSTTAKPLETRCGKHAIKIGGSGKSRTFDLPCGEEIVLP